MTDVATVQRTYPWTTNVDGVRLTFRLMEPTDREAILDFARSLPNDDLMFLRTDITQPQTVDAWINYIKTGRTITVVAEADGPAGRPPGVRAARLPARGATRRPRDVPRRADTRPTDHVVRRGWLQQRRSRQVSKLAEVPEEQKAAH